MFDNLKLAFKVVKVYKLIKAEFDYVQDSDSYKALIKAIENLIKAVRALFTVLPEGKQEIEEIIEKLKGVIK